MPIRSRLAAALLSLFAVSTVGAAEPIPLETFVKPAKVSGVKLSPDGKYLALEVPAEDRSALIVIERATAKTTAQLAMQKDNYINDFAWTTNDRLVISPALRIPGTEVRTATGELWGVNADGKRNTYLFGFRAEAKVGTRLGGSGPMRASAYVLESEANEDRRILVGVENWNQTGEDSHMRLQWLDIDSGKLAGGAGRLPVRYYDGHLTDPEGHLTFIQGLDSERNQQVYWRPNPDADWQLINDQAQSGRTLVTLAYARDGKQVYARIDDGKGPAYFARFDPATGTEKVLMRPKTASVGEVVRTADGRSAFALQTHEGRGGYALIDKSAPEAVLARALMGSFPGEQVIPQTFSRDGNFATVYVTSDVNPGAYYVHDAANNKVEIVSTLYPELKPEMLAPMEPIQLKSRDGLDLFGFLTRPVGAAADAKDLPLVVLPHGGPYGESDVWEYSSQVQILASRGYAVLQVNFRGSGGYGRKFRDAGIGEWGGRMQDDVTDATRWAIEQGIADPKRICMFGGSYGGYSALMGAVVEPDLYRCVIGMAGVYELHLLNKKGDIQRSAYGRDYLEEVIGKDREWMRQRSPASRAAEIKAAVMLIHGGEDERVPPAHAEAMKKALEKAGNPPVWHYEAREGHGFVDVQNQVEMYQAVLDFLDQHIGAKAKA